MTFLPLLLNRYSIGLAAALALMAGGYWAWAHYVATPYREQGRAQERAELLPLLASATMQLDRDVAAFAKVADAFGLIKQNGERVKQQGLKAAVIKAARNKAEVVRIEYIDRIVLTGATECERTTDAIEKVLR